MTEEQSERIIELPVRLYGGSCEIELPMQRYLHDDDAYAYQQGVRCLNIARVRVARLDGEPYVDHIEDMRGCIYVPQDDGVAFELKYFGEPESTGVCTFASVAREGKCIHNVKMDYFREIWKNVDDFYRNGLTLARQLDEQVKLRSGEIKLERSSSEDYIGVRITKTLPRWLDSDQEDNDDATNLLSGVEALIGGYFGKTLDEIFWREPVEPKKEQLEHHLQS